MLKHKASHANRHCGFCKKIHQPGLHNREGSITGDVTGFVNFMMRTMKFGFAGRR